MSESQHPLVEHLRFYAELGVTGVSRDPAWRQRLGRPDADVVVGTSVEPDDAVPEPGAPAQPAALAPAINGGTREGDARHVSGEASASSGRVPAPALVAVLTPIADEAEAALMAVRHDLGDCTRCKLHGLGRQQIVFGVGNPRADLMFVGEAPGAEEDSQGIPFVGRAGQLLTKIIESMGVTRADVYIANVIKCRPPGNRNPEPDEVATCEAFLFAQIDRIKPKVIVALGTFAAKALLRTNEPISKLRGQAFDYRGATLIPTFHPAFLLRSPERKRDTWDDMKRAMALLSDGR